MARTVNEEARRVKSGEILAAALQLVSTKGYERMAIQDLLDVLQISKGAFYHYFDSKRALLQALVDRLLVDVEQVLTPIADDPHRTAPVVLARFFAAFARCKAEQRPFVLGVLPVWYGDENAIVREKVREATIERLAPLVAAIIRRGCDAGTFTVAYPDQAARLVLGLTQDLADRLARILIADSAGQVAVRAGRWASRGGHAPAAHAGDCPAGGGDHGSRRARPGGPGGLHLPRRAGHAGYLVWPRHAPERGADSMKIDFGDKTVGGFAFEFVRGLSAEETGAAAFGECMETIGRVKKGDFESWTAHWTATADRVAAFAARERAAGDAVGARNAFLRASNYYRMAVFYAAPADPLHTALWQRSKDCFRHMIPLAARPIECVDVVFEGAALPAYFVSGGEGVRPTLIALGGFDSTMEEVYGFIGAAAADHGWHCFIFEGPGQWSALKANPGLRFRPDYEKPVSAVVDYLLTRPDVDGSKLALIGYSFGGHLAPRAAAGEPRIAACIPNSLVVDCGAAAKAALKGMTNPRLIDTAFGLLMKVNAPARWGFQHAQWTLGIRQPHEWIDAYAPFTLKGLEHRLRSPMLFLFSEDDIQSSAAATDKIVVGLLDFILALDCDRAVHLFTREEGASSHCQMGGLTYAHAVIFRWLDQVLLGGKPLAPGRVSAAGENAAEKLAAAFGKYGGPEAGAKARALLEVARPV